MNLPPYPSLGLVAYLSQMKGNRRPVCKTTGVQEKKLYLTGLCTENLRFLFFRDFISFVQFKDVLAGDFGIRMVDQNPH